MTQEEFSQNYHSELLNKSLPKWPQMYVTGKPVTVEQAKEIIRKTDAFFAYSFAGNNRPYNQWVKQTLKMPDSEISYDIPAGPERSRLINEMFDKERDFRDKWGVVTTNYVHNDWISCSFMGGPHGWCHPDGQIGFIDNVGKWPSCRDIYEDWLTLVRHFPYLELSVTLFSGESCEENIKPVVSFIITDGNVTPVDPAIVDVHSEHPKACRRAGQNQSANDAFIDQFSDPMREQGLPNTWIEEWGNHFDWQRTGD